jgi:hypothetical protein
MKYFFLGDLHGRVKVLIQAHKAAQTLGATLVCVGDYVDSYWQTVESQLQTLEYLARNPEIITLLGNHDIQYLAPRWAADWQSTGYQKGHHLEYNRVLKKLDLKPFFYLESPAQENTLHTEQKVLVTHAGLTQKLFRIKPDVEDIPEYLETETKLLQNPGTYFGPYPDTLVFKDRGGNPAGIFWNRPDWFEPFPGLFQIFGHTSFPEIHSPAPGQFCLDCLHNSHEGLLYDLDKPIPSFTRVTFAPELRTEQEIVEKFGLKRTERILEKHYS